jgi:hypothetical protein
MLTIEDEIRENNEKHTKLTDKKCVSGKILKQISDFKLDTYFESTPVPAEKSAFESLSSLLKNVGELNDSSEIKLEERELLIKALEKSEFSSVLKRYEKNVKSILDITLHIDSQYTSISTEFFSKSETLISSLSTFWSQRISSIADKMYALKVSPDGIDRAQKLIDLYHAIIKTIGVNGANIAHAIACGFLEYFLFVDKASIYAKKLGMSAKEFSDGINSLKKANVLKEGVG